MNTGEIGILNVGAGDTKLVFDKSNPADCIRAARIVTDMVRRGYALLAERAKWQAKIDAATGWGAAYGQCLSWVKQIDTQIARRRDANG